MSSAVSSSRLVSHRMNDAQQSVGEGHTGQALGIVHLLSGSHVAIIGIRQIFKYHADGFQSQRVGERRI